MLLEMSVYHLLTQLFSLAEQTKKKKKNKHNKISENFFQLFVCPY